MGGNIGLWAFALLLTIVSLGLADDQYHTMCTIDCENMPDGRYMSCYGCKTFITCSGEIMRPMFCPGTTFYNGLTGKCSYERTDDCLESGARTIPHPGGVNVIDFPIENDEGDSESHDPNTISNTLTPEPDAITGTYDPLASRTNTNAQANPIDNQTSEPSTANSSTEPAEIDSKDTPLPSGNAGNTQGQPPYTEGPGYYIDANGAIHTDKGFVYYQSGYVQLPSGQFVPEFINGDPAPDGNAGLFDGIRERTGPLLNHPGPQPYRPLPNLYNVIANSYAQGQTNPRSYPTVNSVLQSNPNLQPNPSYPNAQPNPNFQQDRSRSPYLDGHPQSSPNQQPEQTQQQLQQQQQQQEGPAEESPNKKPASGYRLDTQGAIHSDHGYVYYPNGYVRLPTGEVIPNRYIVRSPGGPVDLFGGPYNDKTPLAVHARRHYQVNPGLNAGVVPFGPKFRSAPINPLTGLAARGPVSVVPFVARTLPIESVKPPLPPLGVVSVAPLVPKAPLQLLAARSNFIHNVARHNGPPKRNPFRLASFGGGPTRRRPYPFGSSGPYGTYGPGSLGQIRNPFFRHLFRPGPNPFGSSSVNPFNPFNPFDSIGSSIPDRLVPLLQITVDVSNPKPSDPDTTTSSPQPETTPATGSSNEDPTPSDEAEITTTSTPDVTGNGESTPDTTEAATSIVDATGDSTDVPNIDAGSLDDQSTATTTSPVADGEDLNANTDVNANNDGASTATTTSGLESESPTNPDISDNTDARTGVEDNADGTESSNGNALETSGDIYPVYPDVNNADNADTAGASNGNVLEPSGDESSNYPDGNVEEAPIDDSSTTTADNANNDQANPVDITAKTDDANNDQASPFDSSTATTDGANVNGDGVRNYVITEVTGQSDGGEGDARTHIQPPPTDYYNRVDLDPMAQQGEHGTKVIQGQKDNTLGEIDLSAFGLKK